MIVRTVNMTDGANFRMRFTILHTIPTAITSRSFTRKASYRKKNIDHTIKIIIPTRKKFIESMCRKDKHASMLQILKSFLIIISLYFILHTLLVFGIFDGSYHEILSSTKDIFRILFVSIT